MIYGKCPTLISFRKNTKICIEFDYKLLEVRFSMVCDANACAGYWKPQGRELSILGHVHLL